MKELYDSLIESLGIKLPAEDLYNFSFQELFLDNKEHLTIVFDFIDILRNSICNCPTGLNLTFLYPGDALSIRFCEICEALIKLSRAKRICNSTIHLKDLDLPITNKEFRDHLIWVVIALMQVFKMCNIVPTHRIILEKILVDISIILEPAFPWPLII